jgi:regulator of protease activity HflC (stomatin/prohibitin superfamily)
MTDRPTLIAQIAEALRENGLTAAIGALATALVGLAVAVTRKAFTNEAVVHRLEQELKAESARAEAARAAEIRRLEAQRAEDRASEQAHRARLEQDLYQMRQLLFTVFQHAPPQVVDPPPSANPPANPPQSTDE